MKSENIELLIIHCAATPNGRYFDAADINQWHKERHWVRAQKFYKKQAPLLRHIGYHYVGLLSGDIESARAHNESGVHARGYNDKSLSYCMIGTDQFTHRQWQSLREFVTLKQKQYPNIKVIGHREVNSHKTCPGFDVQTWLASGMHPLTKHILEQR